MASQLGWTRTGKGVGEGGTEERREMGSSSVCGSEGSIENFYLLNSELGARSRKVSSPPPMADDEKRESEGQEKDSPGILVFPPARTRPKLLRHLIRG